MQNLGPHPRPAESEQHFNRILRAPRHADAQASPQERWNPRVQGEAWECAFFPVSAAGHLREAVPLKSPWSCLIRRGRECWAD